MGFFSSIGNFISNNITSAVHDVGHFVGQVVHNPLTQLALSVLPLAGGFLGIPPALTSGLLGGVGLLNAVAPLGNDQGQSEQINQNVSADPFTPTAQSPAGDPLYKSTGDGKYHFVSDHNKIYEIPNNQNAVQNATVSTAKTKTFVERAKESLKSYWYLYTGAVVIFAMFIYFQFFSHSKKHNKKW